MAAPELVLGFRVWMVKAIAHSNPGSMEYRWETWTEDCQSGYRQNHGVPLVGEGLLGLAGDEDLWWRTSWEPRDQSVLSPILGCPECGEAESASRNRFGDQGLALASHHLAHLSSAKVSETIMNLGIWRWTGV